jgi:hypothetical protein
MTAYRGKSKRGANIAECLLLTQLRHRPASDFAVAKPAAGLYQSNRLNRYDAVARAGGEHEAS